MSEVFFSFRIQPEMEEGLSKVSEKLGISKSEVARRAIQYYIKIEPFMVPVPA